MKGELRNPVNFAKISVCHSPANDAPATLNEAQGHLQ